MIFLQPREDDGLLIKRLCWRKEATMYTDKEAVMYTDQAMYTPYEGVNPAEARFEAVSLCPGYVVKMNVEGFEWKQACSCGDHRSSRYLQVAYNLKV